MHERKLENVVVRDRRRAPGIPVLCYSVGRRELFCRFAAGKVLRPGALAPIAIALVQAIP
jgi:hypothetical protein